MARRPECYADTAAFIAFLDRSDKKFNDQMLTLADAHGLVVMAGRRIGACWSTDRHMGLTGVTLVT